MPAAARRLERHGPSRSLSTLVSAPSTALAVVVTALPPAGPGVLETLVAPFRIPVTFRVVAFDDMASCPVQADEPGTAVMVVGLGDGDPDDPRLDQLFRAPHPPIVLVSEVDSDGRLMSALRRGAAGFLLDDINADELVAALRRVCAGQIVVDPTMAGRIARQLAQGNWQNQPPERNPWKLRSRERQVLDSLVEGRNNRQIADDLNLGEETVKTYLRTTYRKLGAQNRAQAIAIYLGRRPSQTELRASCPPSPFLPRVPPERA